MSAPNDENFANTDEWMPSEQLFDQLKDFNIELKNTPDACYQDIDQNSGFYAQVQDYEASLNDYMLPPLQVPYDINCEVLDLSTTAYKEPILDDIKLPSLNELVGTIPLLPELSQTTAEAAVQPVEADEIALKKNSLNLNDELKLLQYLESQSTASVNSMTIDLNNLFVYKINCPKCNGIYDFVSFQNHICINDVKFNNLMLPQNEKTALSAFSSSTSFSSTITMSKKANQDVEYILPVDPACIRLLKENQIRIRRFLKDELKYDVYANIIENQANLNANNADGGSESSKTTNPNTYTKKMDGPHECTLCERKFVHASGLLRHMEKHALDLIPSSGNSNSTSKSGASQGNSIQSTNGLRVVIKCKLCGRIFFETSSALNHLKSHFPETTNTNAERELDNCSEIPYDVYVDDALEFLRTEVQTEQRTLSEDQQLTNYKMSKDNMHLKVIIVNCTLQCEFCDFLFGDVCTLLAHSSCHLVQRRFECFACCIYVKTSKEITTHWQTECVFMRENLKVRNVNLQRYFVCNVCEQKFQTLEQLHEHRYSSYHFFPRLNKRYGILQLPCEYCESVFDNAHECVTHYEERHYKKYKKDKETVGSSKQRQYLCDVCGKTYTQSSHLWQHLRFHQGVKPFACKEPGCTRKFTIRPDLYDHIRKCHTGERPYHCLICDKRFLTGSVYYQHRLIHRGERRYECEECGKRFYRADALKNHQRIHTGEKPFSCQFCTKNFRQRGDRDKHVRARHSHLDANALFMMQMQKLQLETAAAAASMSSDNKENANNINFNNSENIPPLYSYDPIAYNDNPNDVIMIGNVAFPKSMFESIIPDIDEEKALSVLQQIQ